MAAFVAAPPEKAPFDDAESRRIKAYLFRRAEAHLKAGVACSANSRAEVHVVLVARGDKITLESYVEPFREHAPPASIRDAI